MIGYVLDASVAAKWYLPPSGEMLVEESLHFLDEFIAGRTLLLVPDLFWPEIGNVFWKAVRRERMTLRSAGQALQSLSDLRIRTLPSRPLLRDAFAIAERFHCTVYDCTYVALAISAGRPLVTADERLATALSADFPVRWLGSVA